MEREKIRNLVSQMTLEEKAGMCSGSDFWHLKGIERLGIPAVMVTDGPHGLRKQAQALDHLGINESEKAICFPAGCATAASFDRELIRRQGELIGQECQAMDVSAILGPAMNIKRSPLCGRNFEYYSEDPYVAGTIAAAMTEGVQSNYGCGTTIKHFACNNQEDNRMGSDSILSERTIRELYLKGFEIAVKESQPLSIMTSYNLINGTHAANNYDLCTDIARNEWGFKGFIMTDWTTTEKDESCTASGCMRAGNDLVMPGCFGDYDNLKKELKEGSLQLEDLKACIARLVSVIWKSNQYLED